MGTNVIDVTSTRYWHRPVFDSAPYSSLEFIESLVECGTCFHVILLIQKLFIES